MKKMKIPAGKWIFIIVAAIFAVMLPLLSLNSGNSGDEDGFQIPHGKDVLNYYKTGGQDTACLATQMKYYGSSFDVVMAFVNDLFQVEDISTTRHIANSLFGWAAILFAGLIAYRIAGWRAGVLTMILLFFSPRFLGHSFNNPKDIPFAASVMAAIYFIFLFLEKFPKISVGAVVGIVLSIAVSISVRVGGIMLIGYLAVFSLAYLVKVFLEQYAEYRAAFAEQNDGKKKKAKKNANRNAAEYLKKMQKEAAEAKQNYKKQKIREYLLGYVLKLFLWGVGISVAGYFLGLVLWPYAYQNPIANPIEAFREMSHYAVSIRQNFEGTLQWSTELPWYYTVKFILITIPVAAIVGSILYLFLGALKRKNLFSTFILYFSFIFPVFWIIITNANIYGGWRHSLFIYPPLVVTAGLGFNALINSVKNVWAKIGFATVFVLMLLNPVIYIVKNHPYEYIYFNELAGGVDKAYGNYEMDYYYNSTREASEWVIANAQKSGLETTDKIRVATWHPASVGYFFRKDTAKFQVTFSRWNERGDNDWDYAIFVVTGMQPGYIRKLPYTPPSNMVYQVRIGDKPICLVLKRTTKLDYYGNELMIKKDLDSAKIMLKKSLEILPDNEAALSNLIKIYAGMKTKSGMDSANIYALKYLNMVQ